MFIIHQINLLIQNNLALITTYKMKRNLNTIQKETCLKLYILHIMEMYYMNMIIKKIQTKYPTCHVGGSIGLLLQGFDLKRDLSNADLDFCSRQVFDVSNGSDPGSGNDFDASFVINGIGVEIRFDSEAPYVTIKGIAVTHYDYILKFKKEYALKGYEKHIVDLNTLKISYHENI